MSAGADPPAEADTLEVVVLGDVFSTGAGASSPRRAWPTLLARRLARASGRLVSVVNPSEGGFTTDDLVRFGIPALEGAAADLVTVLVGANDIRAGRALWQYEAAIQWLYDAVAAKGLTGDRVVACAIPRFDGAEAVRLAVDGFNAVAAQEAAARGFAWAEASGAVAAEGLSGMDDAAHEGVADAVWGACRGAFTAGV